MPRRCRKKTKSVILGQCEKTGNNDPIKFDGIQKAWRWHDGCFLFRVQKCRENLIQNCAVRNRVKCCICMLFLLLGAFICQSEEPVAVDKVFTVLHERPRAGVRDPLVFIRRNLGTRESCNASFSVGAAYVRFRDRDPFCERREAGIIGLKAVFSF
jgi:hypothetical protein